MKITIVGCGNMGLIFAHALLKYNIVAKENLFLVEKNEQRRQDLMKLDIGQVTVANDTAIANSDMYILAVKPQDFEKAEQIVIVGHTKNNVFVADKILMKCPSKYEDKEVKI